jgi:hypothetical protein
MMGLLAGDGEHFSVIRCDWVGVIDSRPFEMPFRQFETGFMLRQFVFGFIGIGVGVGAMMLPHGAQAAVLYKLDTLDEDPNSQFFPVGLDPRPEYTGRIVGDLMWLNSYEVETGGEILNSVSLSWGKPPTRTAPNPIGTPSPTSGLADWQTRDYPATIFLYSDPNNDGNPNDAQLLTQADTRVANPDTNLLTTVNLQPTQLAVGQKFFVGALFRNLERNQRPATANVNSQNPGRSWFAIGNHGDDQPSNFDAVNLANNFVSGANQQSPIPLPSVYGNWVLRVSGDALPPKRVPEPGMILGLGLVGWWGWRSRRR